MINGNKSLTESLPFNPSRLLVPLALVLGIFLITQAFLRFGYLVGTAVAVLPLLVFVLLYSFQRPYWALAGLFVANYFIMGLWRRYPDVPMGIFLEAIIGLIFFSLIIRSCYSKVGWSRAWNGLTVAVLIWLTYCVLELFNPETVSAQGWLSSIRSYAIYFLCIAVLVPVIFYRYKDLKRILFVWSVLTLLAVIKAYIQKRFGFSDAELYWLFVRGGATTHIINTGVRYFSFFSDAANYGAAMGMSMVVFGCSAFFHKNTWMKLYYLGISFAAAYGMMISGTRSAMAVPFVGFAVFVVISKNFRAMFAGAVLLAGAFIFLNFTTIGQGNAIIRRARSAFNPEDKSLMVRIENQKLMREYMKDKPFGGGLGHGGGKAKVFAPTAYLSQIPTDSWFVMVWVETGIVGLIVHLSVLLYALGYGCWLVLFRIKDKELRGLTAAMCCGVAGIIVSAYGNEILGFPTGIVFYTCLAFIFMAPHFDKELAAAAADKKLLLTTNEYLDEA